MQSHNFNFAKRKMESNNIEKEEISSEELEDRIAELEKWINDQNLVPKLSENKLKLFLHSCMFDVDNTKSTLISYYKLRIRAPEYFSNRDPTAKNLLDASEIGYSILLPGVTEEGYRVIMVGYFHSDTSNYVFNDLMKRFTMTVDMWLSKLDICPGYLLLVEGKHSAFGHFTSASLDSLKKICIYFQEALPVRLQGVVFVNISPAVNMLLTMVHPFLSKKLHNLIHKYPRGNTDYWKMVPRRILPLELQGEAGSIREMQDATQQDLVDYSKWFQQEDDLIKEIAAEQPKPATANKKLIETLF
ncbi:alpha-tocopherol transfer protein-like isoform X2 [Planococcus citri]|uniref:alpha-tocopherol transfer protein-like isoform X2 n=1 Tax=Planococcus citri TaxID=170843 RepID=UPI0031F9F15F